MKLHVWQLYIQLLPKLTGIQNKTCTNIYCAKILIKNCSSFIKNIKIFHVWKQIEWLVAIYILWRLSTTHGSTKNKRPYRVRHELYTQICSVSKIILRKRNVTVAFLFQDAGCPNLVDFALSQLLIEWTQYSEAGAHFIGFLQKRHLIVITSVPWIMANNFWYTLSKHMFKIHEHNNFQYTLSKHTIKTHVHVPFSKDKQTHIFHISFSDGRKKIKPKLGENAYKSIMEGINLNTTVKTSVFFQVVGSSESICTDRRLQHLFLYYRKSLSV